MSQVTAQDPVFAQFMPRVEGHARLTFRKDTPERKEDHVQEAVAIAWVAYQRLVSRGQGDRAFAGPLAGYAVRQVRVGRHAGNPQDSARDVLSGNAQRKHRFATATFGAADTLRLEDRRVSIADHVAFVIDFSEWMARQNRRHRRLLGWLAAGEKPGVVAGRLGVSPARVSQIREKCRVSWEAFQQVDA